MGTFKTHTIYLTKACLHACMLTHAATFAPLCSAHSESDSHMLHCGEAVLNSKLNHQSLTVPSTEGEGGEGWLGRERGEGEGILSDVMSILTSSQRQHTH